MSGHWTEPYLGLAHEPGGCWLLFLRVQRERFGRAIDEVGVPESLRERIAALRAGSATGGWLKVETPRDGDGVLMSCSKHPHHVGVYVGDVGAVLHSCDGAGGMLHTMYHLQASRWRIVGFYRPSAELAEGAV